MTISVRTGGAPRQVRTIRAQVGDQTRAIRTAWVMTDGILRVIYSSSSPITLALSAYFIEAIGLPPSVESVTVSATPSGGAGPYSYAWSLVASGPGTPPYPVRPAFASTWFRQDGLSNGDQSIATFRCTVTDSLGNTARRDCDVLFLADRAPGI